MPHERPRRAGKNSPYRKSGRNNANVSPAWESIFGIDARRTVKRLASPELCFKAPDLHVGEVGAFFSWCRGNKAIACGVWWKTDT